MFRTVLNKTKTNTKPTNKPKQQQTPIKTKQKQNPKQTHAKANKQTNKHFPVWQKTSRTIVFLVSEVNTVLHVEQPWSVLEIIILWMKSKTHWTHFQR